MTLDYDRNAKAAKLVLFCWKSRGEDGENSMLSLKENYCKAEKESPDVQQQCSSELCWSSQVGFPCEDWKLDGIRYKMDFSTWTTCRAKEWFGCQVLQWQGRAAQAGLVRDPSSAKSTCKSKISLIIKIKKKYRRNSGGTLWQKETKRRQTES